MQNQHEHMDSIEWAAGIYEGEGCIHRNKEKRRFGMFVKMKDEDVIKRFQKAVGCGKVVINKPYKQYAPMWEWRITDTNNILKLVHLFLPFLGIRRTEQIKIAIAGKTELKKRRVLIESNLPCTYLDIGEVTNRGAKHHLKNGEKPCPICALAQREYLRKWRTKFFEANH